MFRHQGKARTHKHNRQIAIVLSFVAGLVNVTGFLALHQFTTNVTGHFALLIYDVSNFHLYMGVVFLLYILSFLAGSFTSGFLIEKYKENKRLNVYVYPTFIESILLISVVVLGSLIENINRDILICMLLYAMGLQNSYVTKISNAVVRTTHLTGLFTDLGIDISHLFFQKQQHNRGKLITNIKLRIDIILSFFVGGILSQFFYYNFKLEIKTLLIGASILIISLFYDDFRYRYMKTKRKIALRKYSI